MNRTHRPLERFSAGQAPAHERHDSAAAAMAGRLIFYVTLAVCVVFPHSFQIVTGALVIATAAAGFLATRSDRTISYVGICYLLSAVVTLPYLVVGMQNRAPPEAIPQVLIVYLISPLLWIVIWRFALQQIDVDRVVRYLTILTWVACASAGLFFFLFLTFGPQAVSMFLDPRQANVRIEDGAAGATLLVYGSLIFLASAVFATPEAIKSVPERIGLLSVVAITAVTSGRTALMLAIPIGFAIGLASRSFQQRGVRRTSTGGMGILSYLAVIVIGVAAVMIVLGEARTGINLGIVVEEAWEEIASLGGDARQGQSIALWEGVERTNALGAGHGIGVSIIRDPDYPWRYENIPMATAYRVGVVGAFIYFLPFLIYLVGTASRLFRGRTTRAETFVFAGAVSALLALPTNPYIESFIFQWMYILPLILFDLQRRRTLEPPARAAIHSTAKGS